MKRYLRTIQKNAHRALYAVQGMVVLEFLAFVYTHRLSWAVLHGLAVIVIGILWARKNRRAGRGVSRYQRLKSNGGSHTAEEWRSVCDVYKWRCARCKEVKPLTKDHIIPVSQGGRDDITNIQPLCRECNSWKSSRAMVYR